MEALNKISPPRTKVIPNVIVIDAKESLKQIGSRKKVKGMAKQLKEKNV